MRRAGPRCKKCGGATRRLYVRNQGNSVYRGIAWDCPECGQIVRRD